MALTAREWLLLDETEQKKRGEELSEEECRKLRMELSECYFSEEEKRSMTEKQKYCFIHPKQPSTEEIEKNKKVSFEVLKKMGLMPEDTTFEEWKAKGMPL